jgi:hypothetical protein
MGSRVAGVERSAAFMPLERATLQNTAAPLPHFGFLRLLPPVAAYFEKCPFYPDSHFPPSQGIHSTFPED